MSDSVLYRSALAKTLTSDERRLIESCLARAEQIDALAPTLPEKLLANRSRREGREIKLTKAQLRKIAKSEEDVQWAEAEIPKLVAAMPTGRLLLESFLNSERNALKLEEAIYTGGHPEDEALGKPLLKWRSETIAEIESFLSEKSADEPS